LAASSVAVIDLLLKYGAELEAKDAQDRTVFYRSAWESSAVETMPHLLDLGAGINAKSKIGNTVLHLLAGRGASGLLGIVLERGIKLDERNRNGETALLVAAKGYNKVLQILLDHGADVNARDKSGQTALHRAAAWSNGHEASMQLLVECGIDREVKDDMGDTAFDLFRRSGRGEKDIKAVLSRLDAVDRDTQELLQS
jgi:ankyrin repeat protein